MQILTALEVSASNSTFGSSSGGSRFGALRLAKDHVIRIIASDEVFAGRTIVKVPELTVWLPPKS